jgi:ubiquinone biosynthesis protein COQ4
MALVDTASAPIAPAVPKGAYQPSTKLRWGHALKALRRLLNDKDDTRQVFEIMRALNGAATAKGYHRLLATREGGRMAYERVEFAPRLMDDAWLDSFAPGTVGAAYRDFIRSQNFSADGLADISREGQVQVDEPHPYAWFGRRTRDVHDIWHVLSGYHRDGLGEACLVAFSYAQTKGLGWAFIALGAAAKGLKTRTPYAKAIWQGYRRGKAAQWLLGEDYERLLAEPHDAARRRLGIAAANVYDAIPSNLRDESLPKAT